MVASSPTKMAGRTAFVVLCSLLIVFINGEVEDKKITGARVEVILYVIEYLVY